MGLRISALTGIQYLGKQVEMIQSDDRDDMVMYEGEPTTNFIKVSHGDYSVHAGVLVDGGYYYYNDEECIDITYSSYGQFIDFVEDFFSKLRIPNPLINLTEFTDCEGVISNKMCLEIYNAFLCAESNHFKWPKNKYFFATLKIIFNLAVNENGIVVYW